MNKLVLTTLAVSALVLVGCGGGSSGSSTPSVTPTPTPTIGPFTVSPTSSQTSPITISLTGGAGGLPQTEALTFSQTGLSAPTNFNIGSSSCFTANSAPTDILTFAAGSATFTNGTQTVTLNFTAKNPGSCNFTITSAAGNQSLVVYFSVKP